eukprot:2742296-Rhodomonas_salina.1
MAGCNIQQSRGGQRAANRKCKVGKGPRGKTGALRAVLHSELDVGCELRCAVLGEVQAQAEEPSSLAEVEEMLGVGLGCRELVPQAARKQGLGGRE